MLRPCQSSRRGALKPRLIAMDGPVAVGKTSLGRILSRRLVYRFVDTGAMYRALTLKALALGMNLEDGEALGKLAEETRMGFSRDGRLKVDGRRVGRELRLPEVEEGVSLVARHPQVREALVAQQRRLARGGGGVVMAGRDIGTVVLPQAPFKVFLSASPEERARRRFLELRRRGEAADFQAILEELKRRDSIDSGRFHSPLRPAPDAIIVDTEGFSLRQVAQKVLSLLEEK